MPPIFLHTLAQEAKKRLLRARNGEGVIVAHVVPGGPAALTGVQGMQVQLPGLTPVITDVIVGINGKPVRSQKDLFAILDTCTVRHLPISMALMPVALLMHFLLRLGRT